MSVAGPFVMLTIGFGCPLSEWPAGEAELETEPESDMGALQMATATTT